MPQVIIHAPVSLSPENRALLVGAVRESMTRLLAVPEHIGQVVLYESPRGNRSAHPSRNPDFIVAQITMYPGRTKETKREFLKNLVALINRHTGLDYEDIHCTIHETPPENCLGGVSHAFIEQMERGA